MYSYHHLWMTSYDHRCVHRYFCSTLSESNGFFAENRPKPKKEKKGWSMVSKLPPFLRANSCGLQMEGIRSWNNSGSGGWYLITGWLMMTLGGNKFHLWLRFNVLSWPSMSREEQTNFEYFWKLGRMLFLCWLLYWLLDMFIYVYHFIHVYYNYHIMWIMCVFIVQIW